MSTLQRRLPALGLAAVFVALAVIPLSLQGYQVGQWTFALSFAIAAAGLNLMISDGGLVSLGHNAFFAVGAYTTASLSNHGWTYWQCLIAVAVLCLALGWVVGPPMVKLGHLNFALITIGIGFVTPTIAIRLTGITGGANGMALPAFTAPQWTGLTPEAWLFFMGLLVLLVLLACVLLVIGIRRSHAGRALRAQRDNGVAAEAFGVRVSRLRCGVFALSVMMAGLGGWLWSITSAFVAPDSFDSSLSIALLAGVVVGGLGLPATAIFAGVFVEFLPTVSSRISPAFGGLVQGAIIIVVLLIARRGVLGTLRHWFVGLGAGGSAADEPAPATAVPVTEPADELAVLPVEEPAS